MLRSVSSRELSEWMAFEADNGPVWLRPDWTGALVRFTLSNIYRDSKKHPEPFSFEEFLLGGVQEWEQTPEQMAAVVEITAAAERAREERLAGLSE